LSGCSYHCKFNYFAAASEKNSQGNHVFSHSFATEEICDRKKEQGIKFFGGEIFRQRRRNTSVKTG
jgi:hypothetical protein